MTATPWWVDFWSAQTALAGQPVPTGAMVRTRFSMMSSDGSGNPFKADRPLLLQVNDLQTDKPVFADFQVCPEDTGHL